LNDDLFAFMHYQRDWWDGKSHESWNKGDKYVILLFSFKNGYFP